MIKMLSRNAFWILVGIWVVLVVLRLTLRGEGGMDAIPLMYGLLGAVSVLVVVTLVRVLAPLLRIDGGDDDAD